ncbi:hypothetical protein SSCG_02803 [Streptomyces clavuligerus]|nr:hypothetical protein SSCG_02803 [Streptomyces clavuligerus]
MNGIWKAGCVIRGFMSGAYVGGPGPLTAVGGKQPSRGMAHDDG